MKFLLNFLHDQEHHFHRGGKLEFFYPVYEAMESFLFTTSIVTDNGPHARDSIDLKRLMLTVIIALIPCTLFGIYNTGYQSAKALGILGDLSHMEIFANGAWLVMPLILLSYAVGGFWEALFVVIRKHDLTEGFLVTGLLFPLILPPTIPLWQAAIGISFGVVIGKEIFGGTGMNILNPALTGRVFLFFSFPINISGADPWVMTDPSRLIFSGSNPVLVDGFTGATALLRVAEETAQRPITEFLMQSKIHDFSFANLFTGLIPGSIGETSALLCLIGAAILIIAGVGSWQIISSVIVGGLLTAGLVHSLATPDMRAFYELPPHYHLVMGGFLFGAVFMATDPVSATATNVGKYIYGFAIGSLTILIRIFNPAYPEGMMLSIIFMNIFAPLIDHFVVRSNIKRRLKRARAG